MAEFINADQAAGCIPDGATVGVAGMGLAGWPEEVAQAIERRFLDCGHPCRLTVKQGSNMGDWKKRGMLHLGHEGLVSKWAAAHVGASFTMNELVVANKMACHCLPQGVVVNLWREIAAHRPGLITKVGLGTFVDPRYGGGKMNACTTEELVRLLELDGEEYLFYPSFKLDVALLRGSVADEDGNITFEHEGPINEGLAVAEAAHNSGGIVIVQVEYLAKRGTLHPKHVKIPGVLVDYVVQATSKEACWQTEGLYYEPSFSGDLKIPMTAIEPLPLDVRKVIVRRCAAELEKGNLVNLGFGIPADMATIVAEEGCVDDILMTTEMGSFGGVPAKVPNFGSAYNPQACIDHGAMFDFYDGGGIDLAVLGFAQIDQAGNVNASKIPIPGKGMKLTGPGGFINISQNSRKVVFAGTFMAKAKMRVAEGRLDIIEEGQYTKFVEQVEQMTFSGAFSSKSRQEVLYVTERCVLKLQSGQLVLTEIAPGIELERDILSHMAFRPQIAGDLRQMDARLFMEEWGGLKTKIG